jgi:hypothetical protein
MKSNAATVPEYLASLPEPRRKAVSEVRRFIRGKLGKDFQEVMQYGVIGYCVPHSIWPHGHHTRPELPLMYMGLSSQKNDMVVYMLFLFQNTPMRQWFDQAWTATGRKLHIQVGGAGCCLRFKKLEDLSLEVIGQAIDRMPVDKYLKDHTDMLASIGKGPDGKPLKKKVAGKRAARAAAKPTATPPPRRSGRPRRRGSGRTEEVDRRPWHDAAIN